MNVVIIDDEINAIDFLKCKLNNYEGVEITGIFTNACEGLAFLLRNACDLVFLDIDMPNISGIYIAEQITELYPDIRICFVTAFNEFAVKAFELNAVDYILKPYTEERLQRCLKKAETMKTDQMALSELSDCCHYDLDIICGYDEEDIMLIKYNDIYYIETSNKEVLIHTQDKVYKGNKPLSFYEEKLMKRSFFRVHKCYLANLEKVMCIKPRINYTYDIYFSVIQDRIPVSRNKVKELKRYINH